MEEKEFNYINAIPLVDVMLVLLTIVLTTATFITQSSIKVHLPGSSVKLEKGPVVVDFYLTADKRMYVGKAEVTGETLAGELSKYDTQKDAVQVSADKSLMIDDLTQVLGLIREAGFTKLSIKTDIVIR